MTDHPGTSLRERKKRATRAALHAVALRLVTERGSDDVKIEEICDEVGVSARTFFNYYPTKIAAAFDLPVAEIPDDERDRFLGASGSLLVDSCELVARNVTLPRDYPSMAALLQARPELAMDFWQQTLHRLKPFFVLIEQRVGDSHVARIAFGTVITAVSSAMMTADVATQAEVEARLLREILAMESLIREIEVSV